MNFQIQHQDTSTPARTGRILVGGKAFETPAFMPVGTSAAVKGARPEEVADAGAKIVLCNTYHLHLRPGEEIIARMGGLHQFMGWDGAVLTDSGGYQIFSLADLVRIDDDGVLFQSHLDGDRIRLDPEGVLDIQAKLGGDIAMVLDQCVPYPASWDQAEEGVERTARWAERSMIARNRLPEGRALFGIVQGGTYDDLRERSARQISGMDFDGCAVGGLSVGEGKALMRKVLRHTAPLLPRERPLYLMGVGEPDDILDSVAEGVDMFDCVLPTRNARNGTLYTQRGILKLRNAGLKNDPDPPDPACSCPVCRKYSRAYLRHLFNANEMLGPMLATLHNLHFYQQMMRGIRDSIRTGTFPDFRSRFLEQINQNPGDP